MTVFSPRSGEGTFARLSIHEGIGFCGDKDLVRAYLSFDGDYPAVSLSLSM